MRDAPNTLCRDSQVVQGVDSFYVTVGGVNVGVGIVHNRFIFNFPRFYWIKRAYMEYEKSCGNRF